MVTWGSWNKTSKTTTVTTTQPTKSRKDVSAKGRSSHTNQNKLRELTKFYEGVFKRSQELKQSKKYPNRTKYFCDNYPTLESYLKQYPLKKVTEKG